MSELRRPLTAKVFRVSTDEPLVPLVVEDRYEEALLVVFACARPVGRVRLPALGVIPADVQASAIADKLGDRIWRTELRAGLETAAGFDGDEGFEEPSVSVVVCTRDRPDDLERCLTSVAGLRTRPLETIVVDSAPTDDVTERVCSRFDIRYVREQSPGQSRARNRGIVEAAGQVVAFTDDDVVVDPRWLDGLGRELADQLVSVVTGFVGPLELETPAQYLFELHGGFDRGYERRVFDGVAVGPTTAAGRAGAGANALFRRSVFDEVGLFAEDLGPGTPARACDDNDMFCRILEAGYRISFDPARVVWHRHRRGEEELAELLYAYGASSLAFATRRLGQRDPAALRIAAWWWANHVPADLLAALRRRRGAVPLGMALAELRGTLAGPRLLRRSRRSRSGIPPLTLPAPTQPPAAPTVVSELPRISLVIPSHERRESLVLLLGALAHQTYPADRLEVVVVLDGCADGSASAARSIELPYRLRVIEQDQSGPAEARERGAAEASEAIVLFVDDDIVVESGCVAAHASAHARARGPVVSLGYCPPVVDGSWWSLLLRAWWESHYRRKRDPAHRFGFADMVTGNTSLPRRELLDAGGFDPAFTSRREDWELGMRLLERGVQFVYRHDAIGRHHLDLDLGRALRRQKIEAGVDVALARKHPHTARSLPFAGYVDRRPRPDVEFLAGAAERAARLERFGLRSRWRRLVRVAFRHSYLAGLAEALTPGEELRKLVEAAGPATTVELRLGEAGPPAMPALGPVELDVVVDDALVARFEPRYPGAQWDWQETIEHAVRSAVPPPVSRAVGKQRAT